MSHHRLDGEIIFECTECGRELDTRCPDLKSAAAYAKDAGWLIRPHMTKFAGQVWHHYCTICKAYNYA